MAPPSSLPAAWKVAEDCFENYRLNIDPDADLALRHDLEALAQTFVDADTLETVFIERLVPWNKFVRQPNPGHAAVADLLTTKAAIAALSANYDTLIERYAIDNGFDFQASIDGEDATVRAATQGPLLKFHGCSTIDRKATVWAPSQLDVPPISNRIQRSREWMMANLRQKDLLVVGFWSDWDYLNTVLGEVLDGIAPLSVTVFDPATPESLQEKAPDLWNIANGDGVNFNHVQQSGADALDELRKAFSTNYIRRLLASGKPTFEDIEGNEIDAEYLEVDNLDSESLYSLRRDAEGIPAGEPATRKHPINCEILGAFHLLLRKAGAVQTVFGYELNGRSIRVVNGAGVALNQLRARFAEAPALGSTDIVVAPGATDLSMPGNVVREGRVGDFVRPLSSGLWLTFDTGRQELEV